MEHQRLAVITTHPIQYNAPLYKRLSQSKDLTLKVFYTLGEQKLHGQYEHEFSRHIEWDIPLLEGYEYVMLKNIAARPRSHAFWGVCNPDITTRIEQWNPTAILLFGWKLSGHLKVLRHFSKRIPILFRGDSTMLDDICGFKSIVRRLILTWVYTHVDIALYVGTQNKRYYMRHGMKNNQLIFAPHAVDNDRFHQSVGIDYTKEANDWRNELGISRDTIVFLFAGKFSPRKDPLTLIKAVKQFNHSCKSSVPVKLILVGDGILSEQIRSMIKGEEHILLLPFQNQSRMPLIYRLCDVFCMTSVMGETWGLAVNEAMACGKPVIASDKVGCAIDLIKENDNGWIYHAGNASELTSIINQIAVGYYNLIRMGRRSYEIIQSWHYDAFCDSVINAMKRVSC